MPLTNPYGVAVVGEGHISIEPWAYSAIGQGTWAPVIDANLIANQWKNVCYGNLGAVANGDELDYKAYLSEGTYTLKIICATTSSQGILDIDIDAVEVASFDMYSAAYTYNVIKTETGISVAVSGLKTITARVDGKNGASSNYAVRLSTIELYRTA